MELRGVLRQSPITDHGMSPLPLHHTKRKLHDRSQRRDHLVLQLLLHGQFSAVGGPVRGMQRDTRLLGQRPIGLAAVAAIAQDFIPAPCNSCGNTF